MFKRKFITLIGASVLLIGCGGGGNVPVGTEIEIKNYDSTTFLSSTSDPFNALAEKRFTFTVKMNQFKSDSREDGNQLYFYNQSEDKVAFINTEKSTRIVYSVKDGGEVDILPYEGGETNEESLIDEFIKIYQFEDKSAIENKYIVGEHNGAQMLLLYHPGEKMGDSIHIELTSAISEDNITAKYTAKIA